MNENSNFNEVLKQNEINQTIEATFFENQRSISLVIKQMKHAYDEALSVGFDEKQALTIATTIFK